MVGYPEETDKLIDPAGTPPPPHGNNSSGGTGLPAWPITGEAARWLPRIATAGCLGLTYLRARQNVGLAGSSALAFPLFGTDPKEQLFALYMAGNLTSPLMIWTLEELGGHSMHGGWTMFGNAVPLAGMLLLAKALQLQGIDRTAPIYFLEAVLPLRDDKQRTSSRRIDPDVARAVLPATLLGHVVPSLLMSVLPMTFTEVSRSVYGLQSIVCHAFLYSPYTVPVLTYGIVAFRKWARYRANLRAPAGQRRALHEVDEGYTVGGRLNTAVLKEDYSDLFSVQAAGHVLALASLAAQSWGMWEKLTEAVPGASVLSRAKAVLGWILRPMDFTRFELLSLYVAATTSLGLYTVWDLRRRGYTTSREAKKAAAGFVVGNALVGPGASYAGLWMWREGVLAQLPPGV